MCQPTVTESERMRIELSRGRVVDHAPARRDAVRLEERRGGGCNHRIEMSWFAWRFGVVPDRASER